MRVRPVRALRHPDRLLQIRYGRGDRRGGSQGGHVVEHGQGDRREKRGVRSPGYGCGTGAPAKTGPRLFLQKRAAGQHNESINDLINELICDMINEMINIMCSFMESYRYGKKRIRDD